MKLLVVSPDYASHALPLIQIASAWQRDVAGGRAIVATGLATRPLVEEAGLAWVELRLGAGSNGGVIEVDDQPEGEDDHLRAFFDATRAGPVETLTYQADGRRRDLLHDPDRVLDRLTEIVAEVGPDRIVVDHVAFGARLALHALGIRPATVVLGHPSALAGPGEVYGLPPAWPSAMQPTEAELADLRERCDRSVVELRAAAEELLRRRAPDRLPIGDLTSTPGLPTVYVYPSELHDPSRPLPDQHVFVGSLSRTESIGTTRLPTGVGHRVTVALGSFLSARGDVLAIAVDAARSAGWRLALAHGSTPSSELGDLPTGSVVARHLPQVALLPHTDVLVSHGGNGSVTEAATAGVPMVVLPFSTDQFAGAEAVERTGLGRVLAPNQLTAEALIAAVDDVMRSTAANRAGAVADSIARLGAAAAIVAIARDGVPPGC